MDYVALGNRIYARRRELSRTQEWLAEKTCKSTSLIGHCERGTRIASIDTIVAIANALEIGLDDLFIDSLEKSKLTHDERQEKLMALLAETAEKVEKLFQQA